MWLHHLFDRHLNDDEQIIRVVHKHWLTGFRTLFWPTLTFFGLVALLAAAPALPVFYIVALLSVVTCLWWLRNFFDYYLDAWIVTDTGIIDVAWHGWFRRTSSRVLYSDVQGVSYEISGVWGTLLRHGAISVEKISTGNEISMENVPRPREIESLILRNMEEYLHSNNLKDAATVQEILSKVVARELGLKEVQGKRAARPR